MRFVGLPWLLILSVACAEEDPFPVVDSQTERSCDALLPTSSVAEALALGSVVTLPLDAYPIPGNVCDRYFYRSPDGINYRDYGFTRSGSDHTLAVRVWEATSPEAATRVLEQLDDDLGLVAGHGVEVHEETRALAGLDGQLVVTTVATPSTTSEPSDGHVAASFVVGPYAALIVSPYAAVTEAQYASELNLQGKIDGVARLASELAAALARPDPTLPDAEVRPDLTTVITGEELAAACGLEAELLEADRDTVSVGVAEGFGTHALSVNVRDYPTPALARYDLAKVSAGAPLSGEVEGWLQLSAGTHDDGVVHVAIAGAVPVGPWVVDAFEVRYGETAPALACTPADVSALVKRVADALR